MVKSQKQSTSEKRKKKQKAEGGDGPACGDVEGGAGGSRQGLRLPARRDGGSPQERRRRIPQGRRILPGAGGSRQERRRRIPQGQRRVPQEERRILQECAAPRQGRQRIQSGRVEAERQPRSPPATRWMSRARAPAATTAARGRARASLGGRDCHHGSAVRRCRRRLHGG